MREMRAIFPVHDDGYEKNSVNESDVSNLGPY